MRLVIPVARPAELITDGYTTIEVWRSNDEGNSFQELTAHAAQPAVLSTSEASTLFDMGASPVLTLKVNGGAEVSITFDGLVHRYWTPQQVTDAINVAVPSLAQVSGLKVLLSSPTSGLASSLEVTYGVAALGLESGTKSQGLAVRIPLTSSQAYVFLDPLGLSGISRYSWRYSNDGANPLSELTPLDPSTTPMSGVLISYATAQFVSFDGSPVQRKVIVGLEGKLPQSLGGHTVSAQSQTYESDATGFLLIPLMQGATLRVAIEGTPLVRSITVPTTPTFDLLQALGGAADPFEVQTTPSLATRRSL